MRINRILLFIILLLLPLLVGAISGFFTVGGIDNWYKTLNKPGFTPPNYLFGPVWTSLYLIMGYSSYRIAILKKNALRKRALGLYGIQLFVNFWWSILFFEFHMLELALLEIIILWICIVAMIYQFRKLDPVAAYLNIPYLMWVSFASVLTGSIAWLNA